MGAVFAAGLAIGVTSVDIFALMIEDLAKVAMGRFTSVNYTVGSR
jgi:pyruvate/2-oxoacid:ferredoxin oxidoreductase alpha subunit